jgi:hypothetical protein
MSPENRRKLADRVAKAAEAALAARKYVSPLDVLIGIGWLDPGAVSRWRQGRIDYLERTIQTNLPCITEAMKLFRSWAVDRGLVPSETSYVARSPGRQTLRFSKSRRRYERQCLLAEAPAIMAAQREVIGAF